jgi:DNA repair protein RecN (Recombination protein N)
MIKTLTIENLAIIEKNIIDFDGGFNIITGETGAGKSLIVDAIGLLSGNRADYSLIRRGSKKCSVSIELSPIPLGLKNLAPDILDNGDELILTRELRDSSISRCFANGSPISLKELKLISTKLFDLHTQHTHRSLLSESNYIELLDAAGKYNHILDRYKQIYKKLKEKLKELEETKVSYQDALKANEYNKFVLNDIEKVDPKEGEDSKIKSELDMLENSEFISRYTNGLQDLSYDGEYSLFNNARAIIDLLKKLSSYDQNALTYIKEIESILITAKEVSIYANDFGAQAEYNPSRIEQLRIRSQALAKLYKRYGNHQELIAFREKLKNEISEVEGFDDRIDLLEMDINDLVKKLSPIATELSGLRKDNSIIFADSVTKGIREMEMLSGDFKINISHPDYGTLKRDDFTPKGIDRVEFLFSANAGEQLKPLNQTASGGEMSRLMVAMKSLTDSDNERTLIFDEIDTGISGEAAIKVGRKIKNISERQQIIAISHLPQIAAKADMHLYIKKFEQNGSTYSKSISLGRDEKSKEIARLFAGENITDSALKSAEELIRKN